MNTLNNLKRRRMKQLVYNRVRTACKKYYIPVSVMRSILKSAYNDAAVFQSISNGKMSHKDIITFCTDIDPLSYKDKLVEVLTNKVSEAGVEMDIPEGCGYFKRLRILKDAVAQLSPDHFVTIEKSLPASYFGKS